MKNFLSKNAKLIYLLCGVFSLLTLILSMGFMTQYRYLRLNYVIEVNPETGEQTILIGSQASLNGANQQPLFDFFDQLGKTDRITGETFYETNAPEALKAHPELNEIKDQYLEKGKLKDDVKMQIFNYRQRLDNYNRMIVIFSALSLVAFAAMLILGNQSRRIYYKSNLIGGIVLPGVIVALNITLIAISFGLMSEMMNNYTLYNLISVLQNPDNRIYTQQAVSVETNTRYLNHLMDSFDLNTTTFVLYDVLFGVVAAYNVFLIVFAVMKYKWTAQRRAEVIANSKIVGELI